MYNFIYQESCCFSVPITHGGSTSAYVSMCQSRQHGGGAFIYGRINPWRHNGLVVSMKDLWLGPFVTFNQPYRLVWSKCVSNVFFFPRMFLVTLLFKRTKDLLWWVLSQRIELKGSFSTLTLHVTLLSITKDLLLTKKHYLLATLYSLEPNQSVSSDYEDRCNQLQCSLA